jgi:antitoxin (DNA-binding transcriptional repressor) of toxin-antitoxin stability system
MVVISSRDFRSNQSKYLGMAANGQGVVLTTRNLGSFKIVPIDEDDTLMTKEELFAKIEKGIQDIKEGKGYKVTSKEDLERFLDTL